MIALKIASTGPLPVACVGAMRAVDIKNERRLLRPLRSGDDGERHDLDAVVRLRDLVVHERDDVLVVDDLLPVGELLEAVERVVQRIVAELVAELLELLTERMPA